MDTRFQAFMLTAETLSMSKAAELAFVSPQCISNHIRSLEQEYQISLFIRRPHLALTPEGGHLLEMLYEIQTLENNIVSSLNGSHSAMIGRVCLGVPSSRYSIFVPTILSAFRKEFPNVELRITDDFSSNLVFETERGKLDMAITLQQESNTSLKTEVSVPDRFYCLIPDPLLKSIYPEHSDEMLLSFQQGMQPEQMTAFPLILYPPTSRLRRALDQYEKQKGIQFQCIFESNHMNCFDSLSRILNAISLVSEHALFITQEKNRDESSGPFLHIVPACLDSFNIPYNISLVYHRSAYLCDYKKYLLALIKKILCGYIQT